MGSLDLVPIPEDSAFVQIARKQFGSDAPSLDADVIGNAETCPEAKITFKVIVKNQFRLLPNCPGEREVRVSYLKRTAPGQTETVTLLAVVPFEGEHEFTCTDSATGAGGLSANFGVYLQGWGGTTENCILIPYAEGVYSIGFGAIMANGGTITVTQIAPNGGIVHTVSNPRVAAVTGHSGADRPELIPIPDPAFR